MQDQLHHLGYALHRGVAQLGAARNWIALLEGTHCPQITKGRSPHPETAAAQHLAPSPLKLSCLGLSS